MGWMKDENASGEAYVDRLNEAREDLLDIIRQIRRKVDAGEGSECGSLYSQLARGRERADRDDAPIVPSRVR